MRKENLYFDGIRTFSGKYLDVFNPDPKMICIEDIAHALSQTVRFGGHLTYSYTVAQHSLWCAMNIEVDNLRLDALLHDASEAYLTDVPRPIKMKMPEYKKVEDVLMASIAKKFRFEYPLHPDVKKIDEEALKIEWENIMLTGYDFSADARLIERDFITLFETYTKLKS